MARFLRTIGDQMTGLWYGLSIPFIIVGLFVVGVWHAVLHHNGRTDVPLVHDWL